nr:OmpA family protein [Streptomyces coryli]
MSETSLDGREQTDDSPEEIVYGLEASVLFAKDSAALTPDARATLKQLAQKIGRANPTRPITVAGYTDNLGTAAHGLTLSKRRATTVAKALEAAPALSDATFRTKGYGEAHPIASNKTESGREKNRRVAVTVPKS